MQTTKITESSMWYLLPGSLGVVEFPSLILRHFERHQQKRTRDKEAGGQLFWEFSEEGHRRVCAITGPRPTDRRSRAAYKADHQKEQVEIDDFYKTGAYLLGDWHTHPERIATPSPADIAAIKEIYQSSKNRGPGFLLVVVGTSTLDKSLSVWWCNEDCVSAKRIEPGFRGTDH